MSSIFFHNPIRVIKLLIQLVRDFNRIHFSINQIKIEMPVKKRKINQTQADNPEAQVDSAEDDIVVFPPQSDTYNY